MKTPRSEKEIFEELATLCIRLGYIHVLANICFFENILSYSDNLTPDDTSRQYSEERLIRTEISTLVGLMLKKDIDTTFPNPHDMEEMTNKTYMLLSELHDSMKVVMFENLRKAISTKNKNYHPFADGHSLREAIFYGGESAYQFQYLDLAHLKYAKDDDWFLKNKGFSIKDTQFVIKCIGEIIETKINQRLEELKLVKPDDRTLLPAYIFSAKEVSEKSGIDINTVKKVLEAFSPPSNMKLNQNFQSINDFNVFNAYPLISIQDGEYLLLHYSSLNEALYETPFYWMGDDKKYCPIAMQHRGAFTEEFTAERLKLIFGKDRVFENVLIFDVNTQNKKEHNALAEIDILVLFGDRALIIETKSKRLTLPAKKGDGKQLQDDFKKAVQEGYNQAFESSKYILSNNVTLIEKNTNREIKITHKLTEVYPICIISDHYPALSAQTRAFLKYETTDIIRPPLVIDIFLLDVMTEMLQSPLYFLSYINRRAQYPKEIISMNELIILAYHLKRNLWIQSEYDFLSLMPDISADLDIAMLVRRRNIPGNPIPPGILTRLKNTSLGELIKEIENLEDPGVIDLGFMLLTIGEDSITELVKGMDTIIRMSRKNGKNHDLTVSFENAKFGFTIHCNNDPYPIALERLKGHCERRKYTEQAKTWFGLCISTTNHPRFGIKLDFPWKWSEKMAVKVKNMKKGKAATNFASGSIVPQKKSKKVGRNEKCPCGSELKYKKCCLNR